jgi:hypothetical protein
VQVVEVDRSVTLNDLGKFIVSPAQIMATVVEVAEYIVTFSIAARSFSESALLRHREPGEDLLLDAFPLDTLSLGASPLVFFFNSRCFTSLLVPTREDPELTIISAKGKKKTALDKKVIVALWRLVRYNDQQFAAVHQQAKIGDNNMQNIFTRKRQDQDISRQNPPHRQKEKNLLRNSQDS